MLKYEVIRNEELDFLDESYNTLYPNLHKYPATMLPQIGDYVLKELGLCGNKFLLLDPYCGSGSSFASAIENGIYNLFGYDLNPLAVLISKARFNHQYPDILKENTEELFNDLNNIKQNGELSEYIPKITNVEYWFSKNIIMQLTTIYQTIINTYIYHQKDFYLVALSETIREVSYARKGEFKLYRIPEEKIVEYENIDVFEIFKNVLEKNINNYLEYYYPKINEDFFVNIINDEFKEQPNTFDIVLTSPPYGDSQTTVAYGQFSRFTNEFFGFKDIKGLDNKMMGGKKKPIIKLNTLIDNSIDSISKLDSKRAQDVFSFYDDLGESIRNVANSIVSGGYSIYVVGNRTVKEVNLPTDQFIAEQFEINGFDHVVTYQRILSRKRMPSKNSPTNIVGKVGDTMNYEYVVITRKK